MTSSYRQRTAQAVPHEQAVATELMRLGWHIIRSGVEHWAAATFGDQITRVHEDHALLPSSDGRAGHRGHPFRSVPDLAAFRAGYRPVFVDPKTTDPRNRNTGNYCVQVEPICRQRQLLWNFGVDTLLIFDGMVGVRSCQVETAIPVTPAPAGGGSGTPGWLFSRSNRHVRPLAELLEEQRAH